MDDRVIQDLKQFIAATVSQSTSDMRADIKRVDTKIDGVEQRLTAKIDEVLAAVGDTVDISNDDQDARLEDHEHRLTRLEGRAA